jgi:hypothetical protein
LTSLGGGALDTDSMIAYHTSTAGAAKLGDQETCCLEAKGCGLERTLCPSPGGGMAKVAKVCRRS